jgi:hypothetical protein
MHEDTYTHEYAPSQLTSLTSDTPCWVSPPRRETNDAWDFLRVVKWLVEGGALRCSDFLILDNARVHHAKVAGDIVESMLALAGIHLVFLPAYR